MAKRVFLFCFLSLTFLFEARAEGLFLREITQENLLTTLENALFSKEGILFLGFFVLVAEMWLFSLKKPERET